MAGRHLKTRFVFKKNINYDLALLREVQGLNPFAQKVNKSTWELIASNLQSCVLKMQVSGRSCRERTEKLLKEFRAEERLSVQASGVEESEMDEIKELLTSICKLEELKITAPGLEKLYSKKNRQEAEKMQEEALNEIQDKDFADMSTDDVLAWANDQSTPVADAEEPKSDDEVEEIDQVTKPSEQRPSKRITSDQEERMLPKKYRPNTGSAGLIKYLEDKHKGDLSFKESELEVRKMEAANKAKELELAKQRQDLDLEERRKLNGILYSMLEKKLE